MSSSDEIKKKAIRMHIAGNSKKQIADELDTPPRTITSWISWYSLFRELIQEDLKKSNDMTRVSVGKHVEDMVIMAGTLLSGLETISFYSVNGFCLIEQLRDNLSKLYNSYNPVLVRSFSEHMQTELKRDVAVDFRADIEQNPLELIQTLRLIGAKGTIQGSCNICRQIQ